MKKIPQTFNEVMILFMVLLVNYFDLVLSDKVLRVVPKTASQLDFVTRIESTANKIDFWRTPSRVGQPVDLHVTAEDYRFVSNLLLHWGIYFTVQISDLHRLIDLQRKELRIKRGVKTGSKIVDFHDDYHTLQEINDKLYAISDRHREITTIVNIGQSYENRSILVIKIRGKSKVNKPLFYIQCGIHAREWISPATCMFVIDKMTSFYNKDSLVTAVLDKIDLVILPVVNVDGYEYTWTDNRLWRKNRRPNKRSPCYGTDLNRNWNYAWGGPGSSSNPCDSVYRGTKPFSELETLSVKNLLESLGSRLKGFLDMHSYSQMWFIPWGNTKNKTKDYEEQMRVAHLACQAVQKAGTSVNYSHGPSSQLMYGASGIAEDWAYGKLRVRYSFSVELRDTGHYGFLLPASYIRQSGLEILHGLNALIMAMKL